MFMSDLLPIITRLAKKVEDNFFCREANGLYDGTGGQLIFLLSSYLRFPELSNAEKLQGYLDHFQARFEVKQADLGLSSGLAGYGFCLEIILQLLGDDSDLNRELDEHLSRLIAQENWRGEYELLYGITGVLLYAGKRIERGHDSCALFELALEKLKTFACNTDVGLAWLTPAYSSFKLHKNQSREFNLGLAHGNSGTLGTLIKAYAVRPSTELYELIASSSHWLSTQAHKRRCGSYFGYSNIDTSGSRLGWCYGDLMNALVMCRAGKFLSDESLVSLAKEVSLSAAQRADSNSGVMDMGLCHGASGIGLIFSQLYAEIGHKSLQQAANFWFSLVKDAFYRSEDLSGFYNYVPHTGKRNEDFSMLTGYSGIGLCLLSHDNPESIWQQSLLIN